MRVGLPEPVKRIFKPYEIQIEEIPLETYAGNVGTSQSIIRGRLSHLQSIRLRYPVAVFQPDRLNPHGRLAIRHPVFPDDAYVVISSSTTAPLSAFDVSMVGGPTIRAHAADLPFEAALDQLVQVAIYYRYLHSPWLPPFPQVRRGFRRVRSALGV